MAADLGETKSWPCMPRLWYKSCMTSPTTANSRETTLLLHLGVFSVAFIVCSVCWNIGRHKLISFNVVLHLLSAALACIFAYCAAPEPLLAAEMDWGGQPGGGDGLHARSSSVRPVDLGRLEVGLQLEQLVETDCVIANECSAAAGRQYSIDVDVLRLAVAESLKYLRSWSEMSGGIEIRLRDEAHEGRLMLHVTFDGSGRLSTRQLNPSENCMRMLLKGDDKAPWCSLARRGAPYQRDEAAGLAAAHRAILTVEGHMWVQTSFGSHAGHLLIHVLLPMAYRFSAQASAEALSQSRLPFLARSEIDDYLADVPSLRASQRRADARVTRGEVDAGVDLEEALGGGSVPNAQATRRSVATTRPPSPPPSLVPAPFVSPDEPLVCIGLDDNSLCRELHTLIFDVFLQADMVRSAALGQSRAEVTQFVDVAQGRRDASLLPVAAWAQRPADVVLLDEYMRIDGLRCTGSQVARDLRFDGFEGLICIQSGAGDGHLQQLRSLPFIDLVFSKMATPNHLADCVFVGVAQIRQRAQAEGNLDA